MKKIEINATSIGQVVNVEGDNAHIVHQATPTPIPSVPPIAIRAELGDVFISYSRADWEVYVRPLVERLRTEGIRVWVDQYGIEGGANWQNNINEALMSCGVLVLCVTAQALASSFVQTEYRYFINHNKPLLPILCESVRFPPELEGIQYLPYGAWDRLITQLKNR